MKYISSKSAELIREDKIEILDYSTDDIPYDLGIIKINGIYPISGLRDSRNYDEIIYVLSGRGCITFGVIETHLFRKTKAYSQEFSERDIIYIEANETYYIEGHCEIFMPRIKREKE